MDDVWIEGADSQDITVYGSEDMHEEDASFEQEKLEKKKRPFNRKHLIIILIIVVAIFAIAAPPSIKYLQAEKQYQNEKYLQASKTFNDIKWFFDAKEKASDSRNQYGLQLMKKHDYSKALDYLTDDKKKNECNFLLAIEKSVKDRVTDEGDDDDVVNREKKTLSAYRKTKFQDMSLSNLRDTYYEGLDYQYSALNDGDPVYDECRNWNRGLYFRYSVINALYNDYGLWKNNEVIKEQYIDAFPSIREFYYDYDKLVKDVNDNFELKNEPYINNGFDFVYENNTDYDLSLYADLNFYDADNNYLYSYWDVYLGKFNSGTKNTYFISYDNQDYDVRYYEIESIGVD